MVKEKCVTKLPPDSVWPGGNGGKIMDSKKRLEEASRKTYLNGLMRYQERGVPILIDGVETSPEEWDKIFEVREDGGFYMGDYILEEKGDGKRKLKEIRFDKVYYL